MTPAEYRIEGMRLAAAMCADFTDVEGAQIVASRIWAIADKATAGVSDLPEIPVPARVSADSQAVLEMVSRWQCRFPSGIIVALLNAVECLVVERNIRKEFQQCTEQPELVVAITKTEEALQKLLNFR